MRIISGKNILNRAMPERLRTLRHCIFTGEGRKGKRHLSAAAPSCENGVQESPQAFLNPEIKIIFPLNMARAQAEAIPNCLTRRQVVLLRPCQFVQILGVAWQAVLQKPVGLRAVHGLQRSTLLR